MEVVMFGKMENSIEEICGRNGVIKFEEKMKDKFFEDMGDLK